MGWATAVAKGIQATNAGIATFLQSEQARSQQLAQASQYGAQAALYEKQAALVREQGKIRERSYDLQRNQLRRQFEGIQGSNAARLGAGNVDISSGSAADVAEGNILRFGLDIGENRYQKALSAWETDVQSKNMQFQADQYYAQEDYLKRSAGTWLTSFAIANMQAANTFFMGNDLNFGKQQQPQQQQPQTRGAYYDTALGQFTNSFPIH